jgi:hypothetical protein
MNMKFQIEGEQVRLDALRETRFLVIGGLMEMDWSELSFQNDYACVMKPITPNTVLTSYAGNWVPARVWSNTIGKSRFTKEQRTARMVELRKQKRL